MRGKEEEVEENLLGKNWKAIREKTPCKFLIFWYCVTSYGYPSDLFVFRCGSIDPH